MDRQSFMLSATVMLSLGLALSGCGEGQTQGEQGTRTIKISTVLPREHPTAEALRYFKKQLESHSDGALSANIYYDSQLANASEGIEQAQTGTIEAAFTSAAPLAQIEPMYNVLTMPFLFNSAEHMHQVLDGEVGRELADTLDDEGLEVLCYFDAGSRNIMTKEGPIETPADLEGKVIRVMSSQVMIDTINALGASAKPMAQSEVYSALQTGNLDGWENNPPTALSFKMYETGCDRFAWTRHLMVPDLLLVDAEFYQGLSPENREALDKAAAEAEKEQRKLWAQRSQDAVEQLKEAGMTFNEVNAEAFAQQVDSVYQKYFEKYSEQFQSLVEQIRGQ